MKTILALAAILVGVTSLYAADVPVTGFVESPDGKPVGGAHVNFMDQSAVSSADGKFKISVNEDYLGQSLCVTTEDGKFGAYARVMGGHTDDLHVRLKPCVSMVVHFSGPDGKPLPDFDFEVWSSGGFEGRSEKTDANGNNTLLGLIASDACYVSWGASSIGTTMLERGRKRVKVSSDISVVIKVLAFVAPKGAVGATSETRCKSLSNYCLDPAGQFLACDEQDKCIRVLSADDKLVKKMKLDFGPQAIACADDGSIIIAGSGKIVRLDADGKVIKTASLPGNGRSATAVATMGKDVFVCASSKSGYTIYRINEELGDSAPIIKGLRGCCGQMDFKTHDGVIYVAANCDFKVKKFDRTGKLLGEFGKHTGKSEESFGGCCEPKNVTFDKDGNVLVSESSDCCVKKFTPDGKYLGYLGAVSDITGCVRVTIALSKDEKNIYMLDTDHNIIRPVPPGKPKKIRNEDAM